MHLYGMYMYICIEIHKKYGEKHNYCKYTNQSKLIIGDILFLL